MPRIEVKINEHLKFAFKNICIDKGIKEAQMLRMLIEKATENVSSDHSNSPLETKSENMTFRVSPSVKGQMVMRARQEGFPNHTTWLTALILSVLNEHPVLTNVDANALRESNQQLAAIGRNLNQIARALNADFRVSDKITTDMIEVLEKHIALHQQTTVALINKSLNRWGAL